MTWLIVLFIKCYHANHKFYDILNQLMIVGIDNYYVSFMLSEIYIKKKEIIYYAIILYIIKDIGK